MRRRAKVIAWVALAAALVTACGPNDDVVESDDLPFSERVAEEIASAREGGASDAQIAILVEAQEQGRLSYAGAKEAAFAAMACITDAGGRVEYHEQVEGSGLVIPAPIVVADDDAGLVAIEPVMDACMTQEAFWVNALYQLQPASQAMRDEYLEQQAPEIRSCLEDHGHSTDPDASPEELQMQAAQALADTDGAIDCMPRS